MMNRITQVMMLDILSGANGNPEISIIQGEKGARRLAICLTHNGSPFDPGENIEVQFRAKIGAIKIYDSAILEGSLVYVDISSQIAASAGRVECELSFTDTSNNLMYSPKFTMIVEECLYEDGEIEATDEFSALTEAISAVNALEAKWGGATASAQSGQEAAASVSVGDDGVSFNFTLPKGDKGDDGVSLSLGATTTGEAGTEASVTNSGTASDPVLNFTIPRGAGGFSPIATVEQISGGARITITDESGMTTQDIMNGQDGADGQDGAGIPSGGTAGQVLAKTEDGTGWVDPAGGDVQTVDGVSPDANGNVELNAAKAATHSTCATAETPGTSLEKDFDVLTDADGNIKGLGLGKAATAGNVDVAESLKTPLRNAIGASSGIWPLSFGGLGVDASDDTGKAAALAALGGISIKKLWTNPNPSAEYGAQTLQLDLSSYDGVIIYCCRAINNTSNKVSFFILDKLVDLAMITADAYNCYRVVRAMTGGISFTKAYKFLAYGSWANANIVEANDQIIPYCIKELRG